MSEAQVDMRVSERIEADLRRRALAGTTDRATRIRNSASVLVVARAERRVPFASSSELACLQRRRVRAAVAHAYETVPFYREAMDERGLRPDDFETADDLGALPLIEAADLAHDPMRFVAHPFRATGREVFNTSGSSSGLRKPIFWDHASLLLRAARGERDRVVIARLAREPWAHVIAREFITNERRHTAARRAGIDTLGHHRLLILPADFSSRTQRAIWSERSVIPRRPVHYHHLPPAAPFEVAQAHLNAIRPRVVFSFGSYADQFFRFIDASSKRTALPRVWVYLGDMLSPVGREIAESKGCRVYSVYGAMEAGTIAFQCEETNGFHLNVDLSPVRLVDAEGHDVPPGEPGDVVVSSLDNRAMALLNYRLGDRAVLSPDPCRCGRSLPVLARLEGRRSELVRLADGRELSSLAVESLFAAELRRAVQAQVEQAAPGQLRWRLVPARGADTDALRAGLAARAERVFGDGTTVTIEFVDQIARTRAGKFARAVTAGNGAAPGDA